MATKKRKKPDRTLTISIHGEGLAIDAKIARSRFSEVIATLADRVSQASTPPSVPGSPDHDFDVVRRVIEHADVAVLEAIMTLTRDELQHRQNAS